MTVINTRNAETINIGQNGTYDVARYTTANVSVDVTPKLVMQFRKDANGKVLEPNTIIDLDGATDVSDYAFSQKYYRNASVSGSVNFGSLTTITGYNAFYYAFAETNITEFNLPNLVTVSGVQSFTNAANKAKVETVNLGSLKTVSGFSPFIHCFHDCTKLTNVDLHSLETVSGSQAFRYAFIGTKIISIDLSSLKTVSGELAFGSAFYTVSTLTSVDLSSLDTITGQNAFQYAFSSCTNLTSLSFPALKSTSFGPYTTQFNNMLQGVTGCTVHFPSNLQSVIGSWADVTSGFGGTNTTVLYDLPATNILTGANTTVYERNPKYDTATALAWRVQDTGAMPNITIDWTPFYTSGLTDPTVGTTIYSDAECTTAVTTISSIS